jgi:hypothetical protein
MLKKLKSDVNKDSKSQVDWDKCQLSLKQVSYSTLGLVGIRPALEPAKLTPKQKPKLKEETCPN